MLDETHDPDLRSWVESANWRGADFPIQNLPFAVFQGAGEREAWRCGVAIGSSILDLRRAQAAGLFGPETAAAGLAASRDDLRPLMALGPTAWRALRLALSRGLRKGSPYAARLESCLMAQSDARFALPAPIGDYTDFFTSEQHMLAAGRIFNPDAPPLPNFKWLPIAYHGRASSVVVSGATFPRPWGQVRMPGLDTPTFMPSRRVDYELEVGIVVAAGNALGEPIPVDQAEQHVFGLCLLNDWSARDLQGFEAMPLGPFLAKNFLTTVSPWIVTLDALAPYRVPLPRSAGDPPLQPHLAPARDDSGLDIALEAVLEADGRATVLSRTNYRHAYWSVAQLIAHHTSNGCNLRAGDLLGSGTQSGPGAGEAGCLLELTHGGSQPVELDGGGRRAFLDDGDTVVLRAHAVRAGHARVGFGECRGTLRPALRRT